MRRRSLGIAARVLGVLSLPPLALGLWLLFVQWSGNLHVVVPGALIRSAQPDPDDLVAAVERFGIRTVLNLRGPHPGDSWYRAERRTLARLDVGLVDFQLSATREPDAATLDALLAVLAQAPRPILVHCQAGADRTGLAVALYLLVIEGLQPAAAGEALSLRFGHFPWLGSDTEAMDRAFAAFAARQETQPAP